MNAIERVSLELSELNSVPAYSCLLDVVINPVIKGKDCKLFFIFHISYCYTRICIYLFEVSFRTDLFYMQIYCVAWEISSVIKFFAFKFSILYFLHTYICTRFFFNCFFQNFKSFIVSYYIQFLVNTYMKQKLGFMCRFTVIVA